MKKCLASLSTLDSLYAFNYHIYLIVDRRRGRRRHLFLHINSLRSHVLIEIFINASAFFFLFILLLLLLPLLALPLARFLIYAPVLCVVDGVLVFGVHIINARAAAERKSEP